MTWADTFIAAAALILAWLVGLLLVNWYCGPD
jgi:hypothetical protein